MVSGSASTLTGNTLNGAVCEQDGTALCDLCTITDNLDNGLLALFRSYIQAASATIQSNFKGVYADSGSYIYVEGSTISSNTSGNYNMTNDLLSTDGSFIDTGATAYTFQNLQTPGGRLTLSSTEPVPSSDISAGTTLYYLTHKHAQVPLYDGTSWGMYNIPGGSINMSVPTASSSSKPFDIFLYLSSGTPTLEGLSWTSTTARATNLARASGNGFIIKSGDTTRLYLGTVMCNTSGQSNDTQRHRWVWNMYNREIREFWWIGPGTNWTYSANNVIRYANGGSAPSLSVVVGLTDTMISLNLQCSLARSVGTSSGAVVIGIGRDSTTAMTFPVTSGYVRETDANGTSQNAFHHALIPLGYHEYNWLERTASTSQTLSVQATNGDEAGFQGFANI